VYVQRAAIAGSWAAVSIVVPKSAFSSALPGSSVLPVSPLLLSGVVSSVAARAGRVLWNTGLLHGVVVVAALADVGGHRPVVHCAWVVPPVSPLSAENDVTATSGAHTSATARQHHPEHDQTTPVIAELRPVG
jgi:hypothetical protein